MNEEEAINEIRTIQKALRRLLPELVRQGVVRINDNRYREIKKIDRVIYRIADDLVEKLQDPLDLE